MSYCGSEQTEQECLASLYSFLGAYLLTHSRCYIKLTRIPVGAVTHSVTVRRRSSRRLSCFYIYLLFLI